MTITRLKIRLFGDPCLRIKSKPVKEAGTAERMLIKSMITTIQEVKGIGLAAPQVGINSRLFVADIGEGPFVVINPKIVKKSGSWDMDEACLSIPEVWIKISRPQKITVKYTDENNKEIERALEDLNARVFLHETDHLDGKMIVDYASKEDMLRWKDKLEELEGLSKKSK